MSKYIKLAIIGSFTLWGVADINSTTKSGKKNENANELENFY